MAEKRTIGGGESGKLKQLHNILWRIWDIWKGVAMGSHLMGRKRIECPKRRKGRLFVGIAVAREESGPFSSPSKD
ncbi:MAG: hypothetical protein LBF49_03860 [Puniceicoccales bacterium]|jgi:hypothetical protein|nr:hypothetical protein [Puniceicoccales bacterium]